jgi:glycosyltransferase involved in cell wall biosynthesis
MSQENSNDISIVIPAYNEEYRIGGVITRYCGFFPGSEVIVVCDGMDNTKKIIKELMMCYPQLRVLEYEERLGKGQSVMEGMKNARYDKVGFVDADESIEPDDVKRMFDALSLADVVIASRRLKNSRILVKQPLKRRISSIAFNIFARVVFGLGFSDTQCGAKVFRKEVVREVFNDLKTKGFEFDVELLWRLKKKGYNIIEFPIIWKHSDGSSFSLSNAPMMLFSLLKVRLWS